MNIFMSSVYDQQGRESYSTSEYDVSKQMAKLSDRHNKIISNSLCRCGCGQYTRMRRGKPEDFKKGHSAWIHRKITRPLSERFMDCVSVPLDTDGCWEWKLSRDRYGYGKTWLDGRSTTAHRFSFDLFNGPVPSGLCVLHRCDNRGCANPRHLFLGTNIDNVADRDAKNRNTKGKRSNTPLTEADVLKIRALHSSGTSIRTLARSFKVGVSSVFRIVSREVWKHI